MCVSSILSTNLRYTRDFVNNDAEQNHKTPYRDASNTETVLACYIELLINVQTNERTAGNFIQTYNMVSYQSHV